MSQLTKKTVDYFDKYQVEDVINEDSELLFILESPHTQEIKHGYPVAGSSGVEMTKFIYGADHDDALGKLVADKDKYQARYNDLEKFSLLNVTPAPMQQQALEDKNLTKSELEVVEILEKLRVNYNAKQHQKESWNLVKSIILEDFKSRLISVLEDFPQVKYLVPCGRFAASYLELIIDEVEGLNNLQIVEEIPHPSFNQWQKYDSMKRLKKVLNKI